MKKLLLSALCVVSSLVASAATVEFAMPGNKTAPAQPWVKTVTDGPTITLTDATGTGSQAPEYYKNSSSNYTQYRFYTGNTLTISASAGYEITGITAKTTTTQLSSTSVDVDQVTTSNENNTITLSSSAANVTLTFKEAFRFQSITVSYTEVSGGVKEPGEIVMDGKTLETTITVAPEAKILFSSMNATSIVCSTNTEDVQSSNTSTIEWIAPAADGQYTLTIIASGEEGSTPQTAEIAVTVETPIITGDVTFDFVNNDYDMTRSPSGYNPKPTTISSENVTIVFDGGNNRLWSDGMRFYNSSYMTISAPDGYILDRIELPSTAASKFKLADETSGAYDNGIWTGEAGSVTIAYSPTSSNQAVATINVSYAPASPALHVDGNALDATTDGIDLEGTTKKIHFEVAEGVSVWYKFVEATPATPAEVAPLADEAAADDNDGFTLYTGSADNGIELSKAGTLHYYTAVNAIKGSVKTLTVNNTPTSIREISAEGAAAGAIFDLQGRKVVAPAKGIYIVNGKKVRM